MGDRAQIGIKQHNGSKIYLYSHWNGEEVYKALARALGREQRWDDPEYLARIIFCEMVKGQESEETGYGIGIEVHDDIGHHIPVLDCSSQTIEWEPGSYASNRIPDPCSFMAFVEKFK